MIGGPASRILAALLALLWIGPASAQSELHLGPRTLYPRVEPTVHADVPLVQRDAIQKLTLGTRLLAVDPRIIGGEPAPSGAFPWVASLGLRGTAQLDGHFCGGAFIAPSWVITAAHCVKTESAGKIQVLGGTNTLSQGGTTHVVDRVIVHEKYDADVSDYDIALLHLATPFNGRTIALATTAEADRIAQPGDLAVVAGWGLTTEDGSVSDLLRRVTVQIVSNQTCNGLASYSGAITERMICAGFPEGGKDSCQGDSGGPLMASDPVRGYVLIGVVSFGEGCGRPNKFGVYTRVSVVQPWVAERLGGRPQVAEPAQPGQPGRRAESVQPAEPARLAQPAQPQTRAAPAAPPRLRSGVASNSRAQALPVKPGKKHDGKAKKPVRRVLFH